MKIPKLEIFRFQWMSFSTLNKKQQQNYTTNNKMGQIATKKITKQMCRRRCKAKINLDFLYILASFFFSIEFITK